MAIVAVYLILKSDRLFRADAVGQITSCDINDLLYDPGSFKVMYKNGYKVSDTLYAVEADVPPYVGGTFWFRKTENDWQLDSCNGLRTEPQ